MTFDLDTHFLRTYNLAKIKNSKYKAARAEKRATSCVRVETESGGTRRRTGGEVKGKEANGVDSQAGFILTRNSPSSVTTIVLARPALQESQYSTELTPPPM